MNICLEKTATMGARYLKSGYLKISKSLLWLYSMHPSNGVQLQSLLTTTTCIEGSATVLQASWRIFETELLSDECIFLWISYLYKESSQLMSNGSDKMETDHKLVCSRLEEDPFLKNIENQNCLKLFQFPSCLYQVCILLGKVLYCLTIKNCLVLFHK